MPGVGAVVVDVAHHDEFEAFVHHFNGTVSDYFPIEECQIIKKDSSDSRPAEPAVPTTAAEPEAPTTAAEISTPVATSGDETAELLATLIFGSRTASECQRRIDDTIEKCMEVARDSSTKAVRAEVETIKLQIAERDSELTAVKDRLGTTTRRWKRSRDA